MWIYQKTSKAVKALKKIQYDNVKTLTDGATSDVGISKDQSWDLNDKSQSHGVQEKVVQQVQRPELEMRPEAGSLQLEQEDNPSSTHWASVQ